MKVPPFRVVPVHEYAILDDGDMLDSQSDHFVRTDFRYGLTDKDLEEVKKILKIS